MAAAAFICTNTVLQLMANGSAPRKSSAATLFDKDTSPSSYNGLLMFFAEVEQRFQAPLNKRANQRSCPIYRLPTGLHLHIAAYLHDGDLLSYAYCSQRTPFLACRLQPRRSTKAKFATRLRRDYQRRLLSLRGVNPAHMALCSHHSAFLPVGLFAKSQLLEAQPDDGRQCACAKGRARVCEHKGYSIRGLESKAIPADEGPPLPLCNRHVDEEEGCLEPHVRGKWSYGISSLSCSAILTTSYVVYRVPFYEAIESQRIQRYLRLLGEHICPHLNSADDAVIFGLWSKKKTRCADPEIFAGSRQAFSIAARCEYCAAESTLLRREGRGSLILIVQRKSAVCEAEGRSAK